uniref:EngB-type G domain-containing protein n=1 Tax=Emiliania huxleyi TaxID=2903 RepID=A0A6V2TH82_EMIHU|mmetsp:Transcript_23470/g.69287  ORF Transcript_23470/g.69287 Transcript_23470/m.69287 type:complete len:228 (-) Transcript_23470:231-914(-)
MLHASARTPFLVLSAAASPRCSRLLASVAWHRLAESEGVNFVGSYTDPRGMPKLPLPEFTIAGRSNVGKSSLLNALSGRRKKTAVVSKTPGRTRLINLFKVGSACTITDLPGYGYAAVSDDMQQQWRKSIERYLRNRDALQLAVLLVDSNVPPMPADAQLLDFLEHVQHAPRRRKRVRAGPHRHGGDQGGQTEEVAAVHTVGAAKGGARAAGRPAAALLGESGDWPA